MQTQAQQQVAVAYANMTRATGQQEIICPFCLWDCGRPIPLNLTDSGEYLCPECGGKKDLESLARELSARAAEYHTSYDEITNLGNALAEIKDRCARAKEIL